MSLQGQQVRFRVYSGITINPPVPEIVSGTLLFDITSSTVYLDRDNERFQLQDNLKLSLSGGILTGDIELKENGTTKTKLGINGKITSKNLQLKEVATVIAGSSYDIAVLDQNGNIKKITVSQFIEDLNFISWEQLEEKTVDGDIKVELNNDILALSYSSSQDKFLSRKSIS